MQFNIRKNTVIWGFHNLVAKHVKTQPCLVLDRRSLSQIFGGTTLAGVLMLPPHSVLRVPSGYFESLAYNNKNKTA